MKKNLLVLAISAAMAAPLTAQAEVKLSGYLQAEIGSIERSGSDERVTETDSDLSGNGSPNMMRFDVTQELGGGLTGFGRFDWEFDMFDNDFNPHDTTPANLSSLRNREKYVGLKGSMAHMKVGRIQGIYKTSTLGYDKWSSTSLQARNSGGGMSGGAFGHSGFVEDVLEVGFKAKGLKGTFQYVADESESVDMSGSMLGALQYGQKDWEVSLVASHLDTNTNDTLTNWKIAGKYTMGGLYMALQYESVETGVASIGVLPAVGENDAADYIWGELGYTMGNVSVIGWVGGVTADNAPGDGDDEETLSYSLGVQYKFNKNLMAYAGYHATDRDNSLTEIADRVTDDTTPDSSDLLDWDVFVGGIRLNF